MLKRTATACIHNYGDTERQTVLIEFEYYSTYKWLSDDRTYFIDFCKVVNDIIIDPSDIDLDLECGIAEALGVDPLDVDMKDCELEYTVVKDISHEVLDNPEMLFI